MRKILTLGVATVLLTGVALPATAGDDHHKRVEVRRIQAPGDAGWLGVAIMQKETQKNDGPTETSGLVVSHVFEGSPAQTAGLREGDVLVMVQGERVQDTGQFVESVQEYDAGDTISLTVLRDGAEMNLSAVLGERPEHKMHHFFGPDGEKMKFLQLEELEGIEGLEGDLAQWKQGLGQAEVILKQVLDCDEDKPCVAKLYMMGGPKLGVRIEPLTDQLAEYFGVREGILVTEVLPGSPAEKAGLEAGDVLTAIDGTPVSSVHEVKSALREVETPATVRVEISRRGKARAYDVSLEEVSGAESRPWNMRITPESEAKRMRL